MLKIAVAGATGAMGEKIVERAEATGHTVVKMSRSEGVDLLEGTGVVEALEGVDAIIDASQVGDPTAKDVVSPILQGAQNLLDAAKKQNVHRLVMLSINGVEKPELQEFPFYKARFEQERLFEDARKDVEICIVRSVQWYEFVLNPAASEVSDAEVKVQDWAIQPAPMDAVAAYMVEAAEGKYGEGLCVVAGGERLTLPELTERYLEAIGDSRKVTTVDAVLPALADGSLYAPGNATVLEPTLEEWLKQQ